MKNHKDTFSVNLLKLIYKSNTFWTRELTQEIKSLMLRSDTHDLCKMGLGTTLLLQSKMEGKDKSRVGSLVYEVVNNITPFIENTV